MSSDQIASTLQADTVFLRQSANFIILVGCHPAPVGLAYLGLVIRHEGILLLLTK
jgi:hypothetical protein